MFLVQPYRLGEIGLVGNPEMQDFAYTLNTPYRLGEIGLVGNFHSLISV